MRREQEKEGGNIVSVMRFCRTTTELLLLKSWGAVLAQSNTVYSSQAEYKKLEEEQTQASGKGRPMNRYSAGVLVLILLVMPNGEYQGNHNNMKVMTSARESTCRILCNEILSFQMCLDTELFMCNSHMTPLLTRNFLILLLVLC